MCGAKTNYANMKWRCVEINGSLKKTKFKQGLTFKL
jgi:hypothetical protein